MQLQNVMGGLAALAGAASAMPTVTLPKDKETRTVQPRGSAADTVIAIMPLSTSCDGRGDECVTAAVAGPLLASGMSHYGVNTAIEQAGILSLVAYESVEMQYKINQNPTNAASGQGTSNEQSGVFNLQFANTFDELKDLGLTTGSVLDHVTDNKYNFWTGPWYYKNYEGCESSRTLAATTGTTAWEWFQEYMGTCDGVPLDTANQPERITYWNSALSAFGLTNSSTF